MQQEGIIQRLQAINCGNRKFDEKRLKDINTSINNSVMSKKFNFATYAKFSFTWANHFIKNFSNFLQNNLISDLSCRGYNSAVIVGAGPSLSKNIHILKKYEKETLIIAVLHALPALHKFNINPDIVVHIDSEDIPKFYELTKPSKDKQIRNFVIDTRVPPEIFNYPTKNIYTFPFSPHYNYKASHMFGLKYRDFSGPNVTIFSVRLVQHLGIKNITLIGNDLSFDDDKLYMDNCNLESEENRHLKKQKFMLMDIMEIKLELLQISNCLLKVLKFYSKYSRKKSNSFKLFNSTEGGAF